MPDPNISISLNARGAEVKNLHDSLGRLGFVIPKQELDEQVFGTGTRDALLQLQAKYKLPSTGIFDDATKAALAKAVAETGLVGETSAKLAGALGEALQPKVEPAGKEDGSKQFVVKGQIRQADGSPLVGGVVRAFDKDLRSEDQLNETTTDKDGHYEITYTSAQFRRAG
ncbi:MAG: peptidoglycan-binding protein, partial [Ktedonobacteraceae bacterium]